MTNAHVVEGARSLMISMFDGTKVKGLVIHRHPGLDLAIVKAALSVAEAFDLSSRISTGYEAGDEVLAIGHPRGLSFTATRGIVSTPSRCVEGRLFVQTDVAINPGNSGGPLFDQEGKLVGINTWIRDDSRGLGFAIPGRDVLQYWVDTDSAIRSGNILLPTDTQIHSLAEEMTPEEMVYAAAQAAGVQLEYRSPGSWQAITAGGDSFGVDLGEEFFVLLRSFCEIAPDHEVDLDLWKKLIVWQSATRLVRFQVLEGGGLVLAYGRNAEDLDVSEICRALIHMATAVDYVGKRLDAYLAGERLSLDD